MSKIVSSIVSESLDSETDGFATANRASMTSVNVFTHSFSPSATWTFNSTEQSVSHDDRLWRTPQLLHFKNFSPTSSIFRFQDCHARNISNLFTNSNWSIVISISLLSNKGFNHLFFFSECRGRSCRKMRVALEAFHCNVFETICFPIRYLSPHGRRARVLISTGV